MASQLRGLRAKQIISALRLDNGDITTDQSTINDMFRDFCKTLYTSEPSSRGEVEYFLGRLNIPTLSSDAQNLLEEQITQEEMAAAITSLQSGKSPGPGGFPPEFYKKFSAQLALFLTSVFSEYFKTGALPPTFNQACISLLLKKDKDPLDCASYRPISLLNCDVKILAKVLASRLEDVLPTIISPDQTGFIKNRQSFFNIRRLLNVIYCILSIRTFPNVSSLWMLRRRLTGWSGGTSLLLWKNLELAQPFFRGLNYFMVLPPQ